MGISRGGALRLDHRTASDSNVIFSKTDNRVGFAIIVLRRVGRVSSVAVSFVVYYIYVDLTIRPASIRAVGLGLPD